MNNSKKLEVYRRKFNQKPKTDWILIILLILFNIWSGSTTVLGAQEILPPGLSWACGITVQVMLFFLLSGWIMKTSFFRKWLAILTFSIVSIYTSFFCYYGILTEDINQNKAELLSADAHQALIAEVYTPLEEKSISLEGEVSRLEELARKEETDGLTTGGLVGCGPKCRDFKLQATNIRKQSNELNSLIESLRPKFEYSLDGLTPEEIYKKDQEALSSVPENYRGGFVLSYDEYIDPLAEVDFITPYSKIFIAEDREISAVFALLIALGIDGIAIIQGTAVQQNRGEERNGTMTQSFFSAVGKLVMFSERFRNNTSNQNQKADLDWTELSTVVYQVNQASKGRGVQFLVLLRNSIDDYPPHILNPSLFENRNDQVLAQGFSKLREKFLKFNIIICKSSGSTEQWIFKGSTIEQVFSWIDKEIQALSSNNRDSQNSDDIHKTLNKLRANQASNRKSWSDVFSTFKDRDQS